MKPSRNCPDKIHTRWRLIILVFAVLTPSAWSEESKRASGRFIRPTGDSSIVYKGLLATFGNRLEHDIKVNLMLPPDIEIDPYLCQYPESLLSLDADEIKLRASNISQPVALFVKKGGSCSAEDKARIMLKMQTEVSSNLKVLILYETDYKFPNAYKLLESDSPQAPPELDSVGILHVPSRFVPKLYEQMDAVSHGDSRFLQSGNELWSFEHSIEGSWVATQSGYQDRPGIDYYDQSDSEGSNGFPWTAYLLFSLLALIPGFGAHYLFHRGVVRFRHNEHGRIDGIEFGTPPSNPPPPEPSKTTLTKEQFACLPEILYEPTPHDDGGNVADLALEAFGEERDPELGEISPVNVTCVTISSKAIPPGVNNDDKEESNNTECGATTTSSSGVATVADTSQSSNSKTPSCYRWTECSICIEEFQLQEKLTLLPRCQHVFHKTCIKPWLLERVSSCPLCKTSVLVDDPDTEMSDSSVDGDSRSENTEQASQE